MILMSVVLALSIITVSGGQVLAKTDDSDSVANVFFYAADSSGKDVLLTVMNLRDDLLADEHGAEDGGNYACLSLDKMPSVNYCEGRGYLFDELILKAIDQAGDVENADKLTFSGQDKIAIMATDNQSFDNGSGTYTYEDLYGVARYFFPDLYDVFQEKGINYINDSEACDQILAGGVETPAYIATSGYSGRVGNLISEGFLNSGVTGAELPDSLDSVLDQQNALRTVIPPTEEDMRSGARTAQYTVKWVYGFRLTMAEASPITAAGTVSAPTCNVSQDGSTLTISLDCKTEGAAIYTSFDGESVTGTPQYLYEEPIKIENYSGGTINLKLRTVKSGYSDAGIMTATVTDGKLTAAPGQEEEPEPADLETVKQQAITEIQNYAAPELYEEEQQSQLASIVAETVSAIEACQTEEQAQAALSSGKARIDALPMIQQSGIRYPVLSLTGTAGQRSVSWWGPAGAEEVKLYYGTDEQMKNAKAASVEKQYEGTSGGEAFAVYEGSLTGLEPDTWYYYQIEAVSGGAQEKSKIYSFYSGNESSKNDAFSFLYMGDAQTSTSNSEYNQWLTLLQDAKSQGLDFSFVMMGGDMVNDGQTVSEWEDYLTRASVEFCSTPVMSVPGNHECNDAATYRPTLYKQLFSMPKNGPEGFEEEFYSFDYGNCHILAVNSNTFEPLANEKITQADMDRIQAWMKEDLENSQAEFNIVVTHHPVYSVVSDNISKKVLENWAPIFEEGGVDLVLCGHQHVYMRTKSMLQGKEDENGITYIMGVSGSKSYPESDVSYAEVLQGNTSNYQMISVDGSQLTVTSRDSSGEVIDEVTLSSKKEKRRQEEAAEKEKQKQQAISAAQKALGKVTGVKASATAYNKIKISWSARSGADGYEVYQAKGSGAYKKIADCKASVKQYTRTGLATGTTYKYKVRAYKTVEGTKVYSAFSAVKSAKPALAKTTVKLTAGKKKITVKWKKVSGASGYQIYRSLKKTKGFKKIKTITKGSTVKYTNKKLKKGKRYYYKVRAYRKVSGKKVYSSYSAVKYKKTK